MDGWYFVKKLRKLKLFQSKPLPKIRIKYIMKRLFTIILLSFVAFGVRAQQVTEQTPLREIQVRGIERNIRPLPPQLPRPERIIRKGNKVILIYDRRDLILLQRQWQLQREKRKTQPEREWQRKR